MLLNGLKKMVGKDTERTVAKGYKSNFLFQTPHKSNFSCALFFFLSFSLSHFPFHSTFASLLIF
jgi:hypothetical protein